MALSNAKNGKIIDPSLRLDGKPRSIPTIVEEWENEDGEKMVRYKSGIIRNETKKQLVKAADVPYFNSESSKEIARFRVEKTAAAIRDEIVRVANINGLAISTPAEAFAYAAGMLWQDVVLNKEESGKTRVESWSTLGKHAKLLEDLRMKRDDEVEGVKLEVGRENAKLIIEKLSGHFTKDE